MRGVLIGPSTLVRIAVAEPLRVSLAPLAVVGRIIDAARSDACGERAADTSERIAGAVSVRMLVSKVVARARTS